MNAQEAYKLAITPVSLSNRDKQIIINNLNAIIEKNARYGLFSASSLLSSMTEGIFYHKSRNEITCNFINSWVKENGFEGTASPVKGYVTISWDKTPKNGLLSLIDDNIVNLSLK